MIQISTRRSLAVLATSLACVVATSAHAQTVEAVADTYVQFGASDTNFGSSTSFQTGNDGGSFGLPKSGDRFSLFRFDLSLFSGPFSEGQVSLNLQKISGDAADFVVYAIADLGADEAFDESTYTFNTSAYSATVDNAEDTNDGGLNKTSLLNLGTFSSTLTAESISFTSTALVDFLNADTNGIATFIIYQSTQNKNARSFASREHLTIDGPSLVAIPEPSSYALLVSGGFLAFSLLRRKVRAPRSNA